MRSPQLHDALKKLTEAIREVEAIVETMRGEHDPLASHIFISRRHYRNVADTKGGKRREVSARLQLRVGSARLRSLSAPKITARRNFRFLNAE